MKKSLVFCAFIIAAHTALAESIEQDGIRYWINFSKKTASIERLMFDKVTEEVYTLPSIVRYEDEEYVVTAIEKKGLTNGRRNKVCTKIIVPPSIVSFDAYTFLDFQNVKEIVLPPNLTTIPSSAFAQCQSLETIVIPEGVAEIGDHAFKGCQALKSIVIPNSVKNIYSNAFEGTSIKELVLPHSMTKISFGAFGSMKKLQKIVIPSSVEEIEESAFVGCERLQEIVLPTNLKVIKHRTFVGCLNLESIVLPENVASIEPVAFENCSALKQITLPKSLVGIGREAFKGCSELKTIYSYTAIPPALGINPFDCSGIISCDGQIMDGTTIYVPKGCAKRYKANENKPTLTQGWSSLNIVEMEDEPELPANISEILENTHKKLSLLASTKGDMGMIANKYMSIYDSYMQQGLTTKTAFNIYDIQSLIKRLAEIPNPEIVKPLAKELKAAKTIDAQEQVFLKYVAQNN
ncbi:MAG: leucine-rich repeat domain-containing protein [Paludibacteraceae bacterium]